MINEKKNGTEEIGRIILVQELTGNVIFWILYVDVKV
jgi:hypothetical protein